METTQTKKKKIIDIILNTLLIIGIVICLILIVFKFTFVRVVVNGDSMNPSIINGSKGYMIKVGENSKIERFDVVASEYNSQKDYYIIKRVLGLPNEKIELTQNRLYVNGEEVKQEFAFNEMNHDFSVSSWTLKDNEYLLVGDNRSKTIPPVVVSIDEIIGKNGICYAIYDITSSKCNGEADYSTCPIKSREWYYFKEGKLS